MSSPTPLLFDTYYHILNRGNNRENIFIEERNYRHFLNLHFKYIDPTTDSQSTQYNTLITIVYKLGNYYNELCYFNNWR